MPFEVMGSTDKPLATYLNIYLGDPKWVHAPQVVPLLLWLAQNRSELLNRPDQVLPAGVQTHLVQSLQTWTAFRKARTLNAKAHFVRELPGFTKELVSGFVAGKNRLANYTLEEVRRLETTCDKQFKDFGRKVKASKHYSAVLPSKTAHLLFPSLIPAYDVEVIQHQVLRMIPARTMPDRASYSTYLCLSWWVLQKLRDEGALETCARSVLDELHKHWLIETLHPGPLPDVLLELIDSFISEYTLIGMSRSGLMLRYLR